MGSRQAAENTTPAPAGELTRELQLLKARSGLTYAGISERTHYAKSSWERWVNGKQFPPRDAVESIAGVCAGDTGRLLDLWNRAEACRTAHGDPDGGAGGGAAGGAAEGRAAAGSAAVGAGGSVWAARTDGRLGYLLRTPVPLGLTVAAGVALAVTGRRVFRRGA
ncbi:helix-turn-helix domain-containing protein [Kitasatospora sp. NPDC051705]|uniref:helix-turn-helix domain-containing protein n=1 Tax=Kitasatospora sp. NPDC051705 TaxID=3364057 RepID=UPI0037AD83A0